MPALETPADKHASARTLTILAFAAIYLIWGSTFLAIRVAVATVPPLLAAGLRFFLAGALLYGWTLASGGARMSRLEWRNVTMLSVFFFPISYGGVFWAEKSLPSGIVSVLVAAIPVSTALLQVFVLKKEVFHRSLAVSVVLGLLGVIVLAFDPGANLNWLACLVVLLSELAWSVGTVLSKTLAVPKSMPLNSGSQMLLGGIMLLICSGLLGEWRPLPRVSWQAWLAILYLAVAGSIVAFTAYVWLLNRMPATVVTSYAYVNPVVALVLGHWLGSEVLGWRTVAGAALIVCGVIVAVALRGKSA